MPDPAAALPHLTALGRALTGAIRIETIAGHAADVLQTLYAPAGASVVLEPAPGAPCSLAAARGRPGVTLGSPFLEACLQSAHLLRTDGPPCLGIPLVAAGHTFGALVIEAEPGASFTPEDESVLTAVAAEVSLAVQNCRLLTLLSAGKREWEQMVDAIGAAVCIVDPHGSVHRANRTFAALVGTPVTTLAGRAWQELLPPGWLDPLSRLIGDRGAAPVVLRDAGRVFVATAIAIDASEPEARATVLLLDDQTERRRLQAQLIQSEKMSAVGQLISGVAHELNNPLASVLGFADFLIESGEAPVSLAEPLRVIQQEAQRAAGIVKNLLTFARRQDQERRPVAIGDVLERTTALLRNQLVQLRVEPLLEVAEGLPQVYGSPNQLQQIFVNLINNGAQAIATTGKPGTVTICARPWLEGVAVDVEDTGPGVPAELAERIFEPFFTTKGPGKGTGLGLSTVYGIVQQHQGWVEVESEPGQGTTFNFYLPASSRPVVEEVRPVTMVARKGRETVLLIDDEEMIIDVGTGLLEELGYTVIPARSGPEALEIYRTREADIDIVVMDMIMPGMGGGETFDRLKQINPGVKVLLSSGYSINGQASQIMERGCDGFIQKPFNLQQLSVKLRALMKQPSMLSNSGNPGRVAYPRAKTTSAIS